MAHKNLTLPATATNGKLRNYAELNSAYSVNYTCLRLGLNVIQAKLFPKRQLHNLRRTLARRRRPALRDQFVTDLIGFAACRSLQ
jgi:hypothetical protein